MSSIKSKIQEWSQSENSKVTMALASEMISTLFEMGNIESNFGTRKRGVKSDWINFLNGVVQNKILDQKPENPQSIAKVFECYMKEQANTTTISSTIGLSTRVIDKLNQNAGDSLRAFGKGVWYLSKTSPLFISIMEKTDLIDKNIPESWENYFRLHNISRESEDLSMPANLMRLYQAYTVANDVLKGLVKDKSMAKFLTFVRTLALGYFMFEANKRPQEQ